MGWERKRGKLHELNALLRGSTTTDILTTGRGRVDPADGRALRRHPRRRHAAAAGRGRAPRRDDRPSAQPADVRRAAPAGSTQGYGDPPAADHLDAPGRARGDRSSSGSSPARPGSTRTRPPSPTSTRTCSARGATPARGSTTSTPSSAAMADRVPENALLSHDLFEGIFARAGLVTDVELFDEFPSQLPGLRGPPAPLGARRLAAPALDPRSGPRRHGPAEPELASPASPAGRWSTTCAGRCPRRSRWRRSSRPGRSRRSRPALWTAFVLASIDHPRGAAGPRRDCCRDGRASRSAATCGPWRADVALAAAHVGLGLDVPRPPGVADGRRDRADAGAAVRHPAEPPRMDDRRAGQGQPRPRPRRASTGRWPAASRSRRSIAVLVLAVKPGAAWIAAPFVVLWLLSPVVARWVSLPPADRPPAAAVGRRRRGAPPDRPPDVAVLRDLRRPGGPRAAARQLPGRSHAGRRASHLADEHRDLPAGDRHRPRPRLDRHARDGRAARGDARHHRPPRAVPRSPLQLVRHARPAAARAGLRVVGRQRQPRRPPARAVQRLPRDARPAAPGRGRARRDRRCASRWPARRPARSATSGGARRSPGGTSTRPSSLPGRVAAPTCPRRPRRGRPGWPSSRAYARTLSDVAAALTAERGDGAGQRARDLGRGGRGGRRQPRSRPRAAPAGARATAARRSPSCPIRRSSDRRRIAGRGDARPTAPGDRRPGPAALPGDGLQLPVRPDPQALLDRLPGPRRHARPELLRPARLRGAPGQLPRDRQGRRRRRTTGSGSVGR